jgi:cation diffusion facilitator CzcD-associated flavoprotein CzcO
MRFAERAARKHLEVQVKDPELRAKLLPDYRLGCKRILISNDYLRALDQPNVTLATDGSARSARAASSTTRGSSIAPTRSSSAPGSTRSDCR